MDNRSKTGLECLPGICRELRLQDCRQTQKQRHGVGILMLIARRLAVTAEGQVRHKGNWFLYASPPVLTAYHHACMHACLLACMQARNTGIVGRTAHVRRSQLLLFLKDAEYFFQYTLLLVPPLKEVVSAKPIQAEYGICRNRRESK